MSDVDNKVKMIVEGLLLAAGRPLTLDNIIAVFEKKEQPDRNELKTVMEAISADCNDRGFELKQVASGYRFQVKQELGEWVAKLWEERPPRYTRALLETLALIAYRQPITRGDIEEIRGVGVSANIIRTLLDREWIRVVGHRDVPGRPAMFATTKQFLDYFNLKSLQELPPLSEIKELAQSEQELDLADELAKQRVIDLPEEVTDEASFEQNEAERAQLLEEEEALELSKKPLDEILKMGMPEELMEEEPGNDELAEDPDTDSDTQSEAAEQELAADADPELEDTGAEESTLSEPSDAAATQVPVTEELDGTDTEASPVEEAPAESPDRVDSGSEQPDDAGEAMPFSFSDTDTDSNSDTAIGTADSAETDAIGIEEERVVAPDETAAEVSEAAATNEDEIDENRQSAEILEFVIQDSDRDADR